MNTRDANTGQLQAEPRTQRLTTADLARASSAPPEPVTNEPGAQHVTDERAATMQPLFPAEVSGEFRSRWTDIQTGFVDTPREAVERADELVANAIKRLAESFAEERGRLEEQWARDGNVSTEDLRIALQRYRSFFQRLLQV